MPTVRGRAVWALTWSGSWATLAAHAAIASASRSRSSPSGSGMQARAIPCTASPTIKGAACRPKRLAEVRTPLLNSAAHAAACGARASAARLAAGQADDRGDQLGQPLAAGVGGGVVDPAGDRRQQRMGARRVVAPALAGQHRGQLHEAGALARVAVLTVRQDRQQRWRLGGVPENSGLQTNGT